MHGLYTGYPLLYRLFRSMWKQQKRLELLEEDLRALQRVVADLESKGRSLELEYVDLYDKVKRQMSRMAKRYAVDQSEIETTTPPISNDSPLVGSDPISRSIMLRRARKFGPLEGE